MKCVVLCAGKGTRFGSRGSKIMVDVNGKPMIHRVLDFWKNYFDEFIIVINENGKDIMDYTKTLGLKIEYAVQKEPNGIAGAIKLVKPMVNDKFAVVLGDCFFSGEFEKKAFDEMGFGIVKADRETISKNFSVVMEKYAQKLIEKPQNPETDICGTGFYVFDENVFPSIDEYMNSPMKEYDITGVMQMMIDNGHKFGPFLLNGTYVNMNTPEEFEKVKKMSNI